MEKTNTEHENEFKEIEITREVILKQNSKTGKIEKIMGRKKTTRPDGKLKVGYSKCKICGRTFRGYGSYCPKCAG